MRGLYLDCFSGISGDMFLGALVDLGVGSGHLRSQLRKLPVTGYRLGATSTRRAHLGGTKVNVVLSTQRQPRRGIREIRRLIGESRLSPEVRERSLQAFEALVDAEARVHRVAPEKVHLHEVGAVDAIVDIVGTMIGLEKLGWPRVVVLGMVAEAIGVEEQHAGRHRLAQQGDLLAGRLLDLAHTGSVQLAYW